MTKHIKNILDDKIEKLFTNNKEALDLVKEYVITKSINLQTVSSLSYITKTPSCSTKTIFRKQIVSDYNTLNYIFGSSTNLKTVKLYQICVANTIEGWQDAILYLLYLICDDVNHPKYNYVDDVNETELVHTLETDDLVNLCIYLEGSNELDVFDIRKTIINLCDYVKTKH